MIEFDASDLAAAVTQTVNQVRDSLDESALRKVGVAGASVFVDEAKHNAASHAKTRTILNNIIMVHVHEESNGENHQVYLVKVRTHPSFYWRFVEYGHKFVPKNKNINQRTGKKTKWRQHRAAAALEYGTASAPAYPFMRPAYESKKGAAVDAMTRELAEQLQRNASHDD